MDKLLGNPLLHEDEDTVVIRLQPEKEPGAPRLTQKKYLLQGQGGGKAKVSVPEKPYPRTEQMLRKTEEHLRKDTGIRQNEPGEVHLLLQPEQLGTEELRRGGIIGHGIPPAEGAAVPPAPPGKTERDNASSGGKEVFFFGKGSKIRIGEMLKSFRLPRRVRTKLSFLPPEEAGDLWIGLRSFLRRTEKEIQRLLSLPQDNAIQKIEDLSPFREMAESL
jgi:hypothetical protein